MLATLATVTHFKLYTVKKVLQAFFSRACNTYGKMHKPNNANGYK